MATPEFVLLDAINEIRRKVHAHNRGGELSAGLRNDVRNVCDLALSRYRKATADVGAIRDAYDSALLPTEDDE